MCVYVSCVVTSRVFISRPLFSQEPARKKRAAGQRRQENVLALTVSCAVLCVWLCAPIGALFAAIVSWSVRIFPPLLPATHYRMQYILHAYMNVFTTVYMRALCGYIHVQ